MNMTRRFPCCLMALAAAAFALLSETARTGWLYAQQDHVEVEAEHDHDAADHAADGHGDQAGAEQVPGEDAHGAGAAGEDINPLSIDPDLAICTAIVFFVLLAFLAKFAWGPIIQGLERREQAIAEQIEQAQQSAEQAQQSLAQYEAKLASAADEVKALMAQARKDADVTKEQIVSQAKEAAQRERDRAVEDIRLAKEGAVQELAEKSVDAAVQLAGRMIHKEVDPQTHSELINDALKRFPSRN